MSSFPAQARILPRLRPKNEQVLVSEYDDHRAATSASDMLYSARFDMGSIAVYGADWLSANDHGGRRTIPQSIRLGLSIAVPPSAIAGIILGLYVFPYSGGPVRSWTTVAAWFFLCVVLASVIGAALGAGFGYLALLDDAPEWVRQVYTESLESGHYLVLVHGSDNDLTRAEEVLKSTAVISSALRPAS